MEIRKIKLSELKRNEGQIEGVPANPRFWSNEDLETLAKSMEETPELTEVRGCIVVPHEGKYLVLGGNMRCAAAKRLGWKEITCAVLPEGTPAETLRAIVIKDNGSWGFWDFGMLADEDWETDRLPEWGVEMPYYCPEGEAEGDEDDGITGRAEDAKPRCERERVIITFAKEQQAEIEALCHIKYDPDKLIVKIEDIEL